MSNKNARRRYVRNFSLICFLAALTSAAGVAEAATVNFSINLTSPVSTTALAAFTTKGSQMAGMKVTAGFADGTSESLTWAAVDANIGEALGTKFYIGMSGDSSLASWLVLNIGPSILTSLSINAGAGNAVFDRLSPSPGTPGSSGGIDYTDGVGLPGTIAVTYSKPVALTGFAPVGDLFAQMFVDFTGLTGGGVPVYTTGLGFLFKQDTDSLSITGDLASVATTPIPGAAFLMGSVLAGGAGFSAWRRKRKIKAGLIVPKNGA